MPGAATGLFWTIPTPASTVSASSTGATLTLSNLSLDDHFQLFASTIKPATVVSFSARWSSQGAPLTLDTTSLGSRFKFNGFHYTVSLSFTFNAQVSATDTTPFTFVATPPGMTDWGVLGTESNGSFA